MLNKEELLRKIKALAENGIGGEKENAQKLLCELMQKYSIKEEEIEDDIIKEFDFKPPKIYKARALASQVLYSIVGNSVDDGKSIYQWRDTKKLFVRCTTAEFLEFEAKLKFYAYHFKIESERFYSAFVQANKIFPPPGKERENDRDDTMTEEDLKMLSLAGNLEKHEYRLQIEG